MNRTSNIIHAGQLDRKVELYKYTTIKNDAGETEQTEAKVTDLFARRVDAVGREEDDDGRVIGIGNVAFTIRMRKDIFTELQKYMIKDFDGLFQIYSTELVGQQHRFVILKTRRRGSEG